MIPEPTELNPGWSTAVVVRELEGVILTTRAAHAGLAGALDCGDRLLTAVNDDDYGASQ